MNGIPKTIEGTIGMLQGILAPIPKQIATLFDRIGEAVRDQAAKHGAIDTLIAQIKDDISDLQSDVWADSISESLVDLKQRVTSLEEVSKDRKDDKKFTKTYAAIALASLFSSAVGGLIVLYIKAKVIGGP